MNILITRPLIDSENLMEKLFSKGHKILHIPTLKILSIKIKPTNPNDFDAFVFTSANAIRNLKLSNKNKKIFCFCVGSITEKIARQKGFQNTFSAGGTVNTLKNLIMSSEQLNEKSKIAYFCGDNISYNLDEDLEKEGFKVKKIVNYLAEKMDSGSHLYNPWKSLLAANRQDACSTLCQLLNKYLRVSLASF